MKIQAQATCYTVAGALPSPTVRIPKWEIACNDHPPLLHTLTVQGHAPHQQGESLLCAAVSHLCRSAAHLLGLNRALTVEWQAPQEGYFFLRIAAAPPAAMQWLGGITDLLLIGLEDLVDDYPQWLELQLVAIPWPNNSQRQKQ